MAIVLVSLAILAAIVHTYRESIARNLANSALRDQGITATDISIQSLGTDYVDLSHVVLEQDDGTRYQISGLSFPLSFPSVQPETISIKHLTVEPAESSASPLPLARMLRTVLELPGSVPNTEISIARMTMSGQPSLQNVVWQSSDRGQHAAFSVESFNVSIDIDSPEDGDHKLVVRAFPDGSTTGFFLVLNIQRNVSGFLVDGNAEIELSQWLTFLKTRHYLPNSIVSLDAVINSQFAAELNLEDSLPMMANARISFVDGVAVEYKTDKAPSVGLQADTGNPVEVSFEYPSLRWTAATEQVDLFAEVDTMGDIAVQLSNFSCRSDVRCATHMLVNTNELQWGDIALSSAKLSASLDLSRDEITRVNISPDFAMALYGVESGGWYVKSIRSTLFSGLEMTTGDEGWRGGTDQLDLLFDSVTDRNGIIVSIPVTFDGLHIRNTGEIVEAEFSVPPAATALSWEDIDIAVPGLNGRVSREGDTASADIYLVDIADGVTAQIGAYHDLATGQGSLTMNNANLRFDHRKLSEYFVKWPYAIELVSGSWSGNLNVEWTTVGGTTEYDGTMEHRLQALMGSFDDYAFAGLHTRVTGGVSSASGVTLLPANVEVALFDVGVGLEDITANIEWNFGEQEARVQELGMSVLGGRLLADPFRLNFGDLTADIVLRPQSVQLQFMADLAEFENIELSGSLSGMLPLFVREGSVTITNGRLDNDPPGGVIRYRPDIVTGDATDIDSGFGLVSRALENFEFDSLTSDVNYTENGDLMLQMKLTGVNPDMDANQPVVLNLGVENNIPQLLRSLRATRSIEAVLERQSRK